MIPDYRELAEYIIGNYRNKVVEIGIGSLPHVALLLKDKLDIVVTDINNLEYSGLRFCRDNVFEPEMRIYRNASLIYSIRPPIDMYDAIASISKEVGADLIIRPFSNEHADLKKYFKEYSIINYKKARFLLYRST